MTQNRLFFFGIIVMYSCCLCVFVQSACQSEYESRIKALEDDNARKERQIRHLRQQLQQSQVFYFDFEQCVVVFKLRISFFIMFHIFIIFGEVGGGRYQSINLFV